MGEHRGAFAHALVRRRVVAYVTRDRGGTTELLTIRAPGYPVEVPAGRLDHGETLEEGLTRELFEETGVNGARIVRELPDFDASYENFCENHAFHVVVEHETPDSWTHQVHGTGADSEMLHHCEWSPLARGLLLWGAPDPMLAKLGL